MRESHGECDAAAFRFPPRGVRRVEPWRRRRVRFLDPTADANGAAAATTPVASPAADVGADAVIALVDAAMPQYHLKAAIARVVIDGQELVTIARGETMNGVPATPAMHFRNGAVAISYVSTALLVLVDQGVVGLDDVLATWLPDLPDADTTTLRMLANMTAGYPDYVNTDQFAAAHAAIRSGAGPRRTSSPSAWRSAGRSPRVRTGPIPTRIT